MTINLDKPIRATMLGKVKQSKGYWHNGRRLAPNLLLILTQGELEIELDKRVYHVEKGDAILVPSGVEYKPLATDGCEYRFFHFVAHTCEPSEIEFVVSKNAMLPKGEYAYAFSENESSTININEVTRCSDFGKILNIFAEATELDLKQNKKAKPLLDNLLARLLICISQESEPQFNTSKRLSEIIKHINASYASKITLSSLAEQFKMSKGYIARLFREELHTTVVDYVIDVKIKKACELLSATSQSISEIALATGYDSVYYFSRVFRKHIGISPRVFRNNYKLP